MKLDFNKVLILGLIKLATVAAFAHSVRPSAATTTTEVEKSLCQGLQDLKLDTANACYQAGNYSGKVALAETMQIKARDLNLHIQMSRNLQGACALRGTVDRIQAERLRGQVVAEACRGV